MPGHVRREIERVGRERALDGAAIGRERDHAFRRIAVELDVDVGQRHDAVGDTAMPA